MVPTTASELPGAPRIAAIDIGTNSVRLIVAEMDGPDSYRVLDDEREQTRLGYRLQKAGVVDPSNYEATLDALQRMKVVAEGFGVEEIRAVATAALREAGNGPDFVEDARARFDLIVQVISPEEEAELALRSVHKHFPTADHPAAIVDIGGGSMEIVFTTAGVIDRIHSLSLGAVRLTERFVHSDPISESDLDALRDAIDRELEDSMGKPPFPTPDMIGSGGTFTAVAGMAVHDRRGEIGHVQGTAMTLPEFEHQVRRLREAPLELRRQIQGLNPERADIILAGAMAVTRLAVRLDVSRILVNDLGVRDGILLEMISRRRRGGADVVNPVVRAGPAASGA